MPLTFVQRRDNALQARSTSLNCRHTSKNLKSLERDEVFLFDGCVIFLQLIIASSIHVTRSRCVGEIAEVDAESKEDF